MADVWGEPRAVFEKAPAGALWLIDRRVEWLHRLRRSMSAPLAVVEVAAGERAKSFATLERVARAATALPRSGTLIAVGGGTIGDLAGVAAHLIKRGVRLIHVPTTWLAAVDSSVGGKGALNVGGAKNAVGVFHEASEWWLCPSIFTTLSDRQRREGVVEALKMAVCLDASVWQRWSKSLPDERELIETSRRLKRQVVAKDPLETKGIRAVLNFGHTFGHVIESVTKYRVRHGEAVELGIVCALDVGRSLGRTSNAVAAEVEAALDSRARARLANALSGSSVDDVSRWLSADKKSDADGLKMVLLRKPGQTEVTRVTKSDWSKQLIAWRNGVRP